MGGIGAKDLVRLLGCKVGSQKAFMQQTGMNKCMFSSPPFLQRRELGNGKSCSGCRLFGKSVQKKKKKKCKKNQIKKLETQGAAE